MTVGPLIAAIGLALLVRSGPTAGYWLTIFPAVIVFGLGLSITVAPLTATVLAAAGPEHAGITGRAALDPGILSAGFRTAMWIAATLVAAGGALSYLTIRDTPAAVEVSATSAPAPAHHVSCPLDAPPLRRVQRGG